MAIHSSNSTPFSQRSVLQAVLVPEMRGLNSPPAAEILEQAPAYPFHLSRDKAGTVKEPGKVRAFWSEHGLYVRADFVDTDIQFGQDMDEIHHYQHGDTFEVFLRPQNDTYYWEMYVTPLSRKATLYFSRGKTPGMGYDPLDGHDYQFIDVRGSVNGTVNDSQDVDTGWTAEMWVPAEQITREGETWGPGSEWTIFFGRYNYNNGTEKAELSMFPQLEVTNYHRVQEYAAIKFLG